MKILNHISLAPSVTITLSVVMSISFVSLLVYGSRDVIELYIGAPITKEHAVLINSLSSNGLLRGGDYYQLRSPILRITDIDGQLIDFNVPPNPGIDQRRSRRC